MGAVIVELPLDLCIAQRAGNCKIACYKSLVNTLESLKADESANGNQRQGFNQFFYKRMF